MCDRCIGGRICFRNTREHYRSSRDCIRNTREHVIEASEDGDVAAFLACVWREKKKSRLGGVRHLLVVEVLNVSVHVQYTPLIRNLLASRSGDRVMLKTLESTLCGLSKRIRLHSSDEAEFHYNPEEDRLLQQGKKRSHCRWQSSYGAMSGWLGAFACTNVVCLGLLSIKPYIITGTNLCGVKRPRQYSARVNQSKRQL